VNVKNCVLLTGAGFSKNFGAPLAADVWALLFSHPDVGLQPRVRNLLRKQFDFESVYQQVMMGDFDAREKSAMRKAVEDTYSYIDSILESYKTNARLPNIYEVQKFLNAFAGDRRSPGFIFTLNQDLFMERHFYNSVRPTLPFIPASANWFSLNFSLISSPFENQVTIPETLSPSMQALGSDSFYYVKLHGSSNWYRSGGERSMVIGGAKHIQIAEDRLLSFYADLFRAVLVEGSKRVLCIGYSFRDPHINDVLADAVRSGTEIFILGPGSADQVAMRIMGCHRGEEIWNGLSGYFPFDLVTMFPADQHRTEESKFVSYQLFGRALL
jgi:hypothetical protein